MNNIYYAPEGFMEEKKESLSAAILERAINTKQILEARAVMCDSDHNLIVDLGDIRGIIPREEAAIGIREGQVSDIAVLSRAGKQICFRVDDLERQGTKQSQNSAAFLRKKTRLNICSKITDAEM